MSKGTVLTEERFIELFDSMLKSRLESILEPMMEPIFDRKFAEFEVRMDKRIDDKMDKKLAPIIKSLEEVKGYMKHESAAIESEIGLVLKDNLKKKYPDRTVTKFPLLALKDPFTGLEITDLDAAYLVQPLLKTPDYSRLAVAGLPPPTIKPIGISTKSIFVLAEAKHYVNRKKIAEKLAQFERIIAMFQEANIALNTKDETVLKKYSKDFINTVKRNPYFANIGECQLCFGALYWEPGVMTAFEEDIDNYNALCLEFQHSNSKIELFNKITALERKWYGRNRNLPEEVINKLDKVDGILGNVVLIYPSGQRYQIADPDAEHPSGIGTVAMRGGKKTKKNKH